MSPRVLVGLDEAIAFVLVPVCYNSADRVWNVSFVRVIILVVFFVLVVILVVILLVIRERIKLGAELHPHS